MSSSQYLELKEELKADRNGRASMEKVIEFLGKMGIPTFDEEGGTRILPSVEPRSDTRVGPTLYKINEVLKYDPPSRLTLMFFSSKFLLLFL